MRALSSIHILGSREFGGADRFFIRLVEALARQHQPVIAVTRPNSPVSDVLSEGAVRQINISLANKWDFMSMFKIRHLIQREKPAVVQTYMGRASRLTRIPDNLDTVHVARLGGYYKIDGYYRHADAWIGNTKDLCDYMIRQGLPSKKVFHIGNFVGKPTVLKTDARDQLRRQVGLPDDAWVVFSLARFVAKKGMEDLIRALSSLPKVIQGRPVYLLLVGEGPELLRLKALVGELRVENQVIWAGWQRDPEPYFNLADVFVCPSRHEPLGNVILEAWNHRLPVLTTETHGAAELVEPDFDALVAPCSDIKGMSKMLKHLLSLGDAERRALGENGNKKLLSRYGEDVIVGQYKSLYLDLQRD